MSKNYYPQVLSEECIYVIKEKGFINILLMIWKFLMILMKGKKSDGKTSDYEEKSNEEFLKKILMKKILVKKKIFFLYILKNGK